MQVAFNFRTSDELSKHFPHGGSFSLFSDHGLPLARPLSMCIESRLLPRTFNGADDFLDPTLDAVFLIANLQGQAEFLLV
jgi:hypothetical protein